MPEELAVDVQRLITSFGVETLTEVAALVADAAHLPSHFVSIDEAGPAALMLGVDGTGQLVGFPTTQTALIELAIDLADSQEDHA